MMGEDAPQRDYGAVERMMQDQSTTAKARPTIPKFVLTLIVVLLLGTACVLAVALHRADKQMSQDLYAFEEDDMDNKHIVWNGREWIDEDSGKAISLKTQHLQMLLANKVRMQELAAVSPGGARPNYNCCYVPKILGSNGGVSVLGSSELVESGMFCHMAIKNKPSSQWPMIRMGSLREAGVTTDDDTGAKLLKEHKLHHCHNDLIFKTQNFAVLASSQAVEQMLSQVAKSR